MLTAISNGILFFAVFFLVYYLPGRLFFGLLSPKRYDEESLPFSLGLGILLVNVPAVTITGIFNLFWPHFLSREAIFAVASIEILVLSVLRLRRDGWKPAKWIRRPSKTLAALWLLTAGSTFFYLVYYDLDSFKEDRCLLHAALMLNVRYNTPELLVLNSGGKPPSVNQLDMMPEKGKEYSPFFKGNQGQRFGPNILIPPFVLLFGFFGFRMVYALQGLLLPGLGFLLGKYFFKEKWAPWLVAILLTFNPYSLGSQGMDENFMATCFGTLTLALLFRPDPSLFLAGMAMSLFTGIRPEGFLCFPFVLFFIRCRTGLPKYSMLRFLGGFLLFGIPHLINYGYYFLNGFILLPAMTVALTPHSFLGMDFQLHVMLNFPFVPEPLRSPYSAYPALFGIPLDMLRRFGLLFAAFVPAGLVYLYGKDRSRCLLLVSWVAPFLTLLMIQSNWSEPIKMGIPGTVLAPMVLIIAGGIVFLFGGGVKFAKKLLLTGIGLVLPVSFFLVTSGISAPMDERVYYYKVDFDRSHPAPFKLKGKDTPDYVEWDRRRYDLRLFPDLRFGQFHSALVRLKLNQFTDELARPSVREYERPFMDYLPALLTGGLDAISPVSIYKVLELNVPRKNLYPFQMYKAEAKSGESYSCVELVLKESPALAAKPLVPGCMNPGMEPLVMDGRASYIINGLRAGWGGEEYPLRIIAARDRFGTINLAIAPYEPEDIEPFDEMNLIEVDASHLKQASIPLLLPQNTLIRITDTPLGAVDLNYLSYTRNSIIEPEGVWISEATPYSD